MGLGAQGLGLYYAVTAAIRDAITVTVRATIRVL